MKMPSEDPPTSSDGIATSVSLKSRHMLVSAIIGLLIVALLVGASMNWRGSPTDPVDPMIAIPKRATVIIPATVLPTIEPVEIVVVAPEIAKKINSAVPIVASPVPPARPFFLTGGETNFMRARDCLASAIYYEAGAETLEGRQAVAQVVINRMRHPAFPKTICGVVYQGQERSTGCQFSFTCDGSIVRRQPSPEAWESARKIAKSMLSGTVYKPVGYATHYHTDWVLPAWSARLDKVWVQSTHLFFRWTGWWGTPPAFRGQYVGGEMQIAKLGTLSPSHFVPETAVALAPDGTAAPILGAIPPNAAENTRPLPPLTSAKRTFTNATGDYQIFLVSRGTESEALLNLTRNACGNGPYCKIMVWADGRIVPTQLPVSDDQLDKLAFSYLRNSSGGFEKALWNCKIFRRVNPAECMKPRPAPTPAPTLQSEAAPAS